MFKKLLGFLIVSMLFGVILSACFVDYDPLENMHSQYKDAGGNFITGSGIGDARGFYNTFVTVELWLENGWIKKAKVSGPDESPGYGAVVIESAKQLIEFSNSVEMDTIAGATTTTKAVVAAGRAALINAGVAED